ncbi:hypothetical protein B5F19_15850 [Pseudoflavonifractor sp. An184]|nr:hypothetical protein B5F19_15850 [Pseudoflavonifractor sp. An184]
MLKDCLADHWRQALESSVLTTLYLPWEAMSQRRCHTCTWQMDRLLSTFLLCQRIMILGCRDKAGRHNLVVKRMQHPLSIAKRV